MEIIQSTKLSGVILVKPQVFSDNRGYFFECFSEKELAPFIDITNFVQHNESYSHAKGVLRGIHWQNPPKNQAKLVRVIQGKIFDVVVDIRPDSLTFGQWESYELNSDSKNLLYIPHGFAHGFQTLTSDVIFHYLCDDYYDKTTEAGIIYNDPDINISWPLDIPPILSDKDKMLPPLSEIKLSLPSFIHHS